MANYGKTDWADSSRGNNANKIDYKEKFVKLSDGQRKVKTLLRIVSPLYKYMVHTVNFPGDVGNAAKFGRQIRCALNDCPLCKEGNQAKEKYYMAVIVRKTGQIKYVDMKWSLKKAIMDSKDSPIFADEGDISPTDYDVQIIADPSSPGTGYYTAQPAGKKPLSAQDLSLIEESDFDEELQKMCEPPSAKEISESIERINKWIAKNSSENKNTSSSDEDKEEEKPQKASKAAAVQEKEETVDDADFTFRTVKK